MNENVNDYVVFKTADHVKGYINDTDYINIFVTEYNGTELTEDLINYMNCTSKDISGVQGFLYHDDTGYTYTFAKDNKVISIQSDNEALIAPVIA